MIPLWIQAAVLILLLLYAFWRCAEPERFCAAVPLAMLLVDRVYHLIFDRPAIYLSLDVCHFTIDCAGAVALVAVALFANRMYPIWMSSIQLISALGHLARVGDQDLIDGAYAIMIQAPFYFLIAVLTGGIISHRRRVRHFGTYRSWRRS
jgi:hypothetical protein